MEINGIAHTFLTAAKQSTVFDQSHCGLYPICFRMRSREDVDELYALLKNLGAPVVHAPQEDGWAPGYYSVLFEDPDGIRLEANFVPGKGLLS